MLAPTLDAKPNLQGLLNSIDTIACTLESCNICNMTFTIQHNLKRHCKRWHENPLRLYHLPKVCEVCKEEFPRRYLLLAHMKEAHNRLLYKCELCEKSFSEPMKLRRHVNSTVHQKFFCTICTTAFGSQEELKEHKTTHFPFSEYKCDICGKKYVTKRNLRTHISDHMKSTIIMCSYEGCNRLYYFQRNLDQHIRTFHLGEKWTCPSCPAQLASKQKLRIHIEKIHLNPTPRKPPPTNENRKRRWDACMPKKSAVSQLLGLKLPIKAEKDIINRLENHLELK
ncbi:zinc finger and BTB domain-containing protein 24-like isoform X2 [Belonocnema kinseyi]|uniref:zinc finger and BTB domain-containing protein 24-like isoform X2 n=1 Tax=Belonocnema kinseyi TaxID=2817044 RepID=UPI00143CED3F|nr:zinc finger and BTB domain-containing protein 24-like isoform X2 [Belonocnema kinseyi]